MIGRGIRAAHVRRRTGGDELSAVSTRARKEKNAPTKAWRHFWQMMFFAASFTFACDLEPLGSFFAAFLSRFC